MVDPARGRVRVKICGITRQGDAMDAIRAGADALGFNGWAGSRRFLDLDAASQWIRTLPPWIFRVAVLVNADLGEILRIAALPGIDGVQLHGDETPDLCASVLAAGVPCTKAVRLASEDDLRGLSDFLELPILLDAACPGAYGGTGSRIATELAAEAVRRLAPRPVILAGGLDPNNVAEAVALVNPYGVDVAGGVERSPGIKDAGKMARFVAATIPRISG